MYHAPQSDGDGTARWQAASLSHAQIVVEPNDAPPRDTGLATRLAQWRTDLVARIAATDIAPDLAPDLAEAIGSRRWFRGAGTILALMAGALALWPDFAPLEAAASLSADDTENARIHDEYRSQMIMPLALGGDTGRRMGATPQVIALRSAPERPQMDVVATLSQGDSFDRMLQRAGVGHADAARVAQLVARTIPIDGIEPGTQVDITLGRRTAPGVPRPLDNLHFRARFDLALKLERTSGTLALRRLPIRVDDTPLRIRGKVGGSLYRSARAAGAPASAVQQFLETLGDHVDLDRSVGAQDAFDIIIAHRRAETGERLAGKLLYAGIERGGKPRTQLMRWGSKGEFFEASGIGEQRSGLMAPVPGAVSSRYGMRRHPILGYRRMHAGLDFKAGRGHADRCRYRRAGYRRRSDGRMRQRGTAESHGRSCHALLPYEPDRGARGAIRAARTGHRLCRVDRAIDGAAFALRNVQQRPFDRSRVGQIRHPCAAFGRGACRFSRIAAPVAADKDRCCTEVVGPRDRRRKPPLARNRSVADVQTFDVNRQYASSEPIEPGRDMRH